MLKAPKFWYLKKDTFFSSSLYPLSIVFRLGTKLRRILSNEKVSELTIICIGNFFVGGAGKTPVSLKIGKTLSYFFFTFIFIFLFLGHFPINR